MDALKDQGVQNMPNWKQWNQMEGWFAWHYSQSSATDAIFTGKWFFLYFRQCVGHFAVTGVSGSHSKKRSKDARSGIIEAIPERKPSSHSKKRSKDARLDIIEAIPETEPSLEVLDEYDNENQQMEEEGKESGLPNFRRFKRRSNQSASYTTNEDRVINRFFKPLGLGFEQALGTWAVKIARCGCNGLLPLSGAGWTSYIFHHDLSLYGMIWFEETNQMVFQTHVFDRSACEKKFPDNLA
ncbi:OLC1v1016752C1 [Oldenlandia corymbosa var. corymbosa]|uniref:OLC1v1016752C1 n=1 Tax=Oldenlandia corymbosa var. corymbosa TaxID=529605 RepID=A0AAV1E7U6_OLDCO|nr:OLC1v1016752C1 [Oldenlandia corymbosa var. corymbosa]